MMDSILYLEGRCTLQKIFVTTPSFMALFALSCCESIQLKVVIVDMEQRRDVVMHEIKLNFLFNLQFMSIDDCPVMVQNCRLPAAEICGHLWCTSGLSSAMRQIFLNKVSLDGDQVAERLLGFRNSCLQACAEVSVWTKFCEIEVTEMVDKWVENKCANTDFSLPKELVRFENHLKCPPITHNMLKKKQEHLGKNMTKGELSEFKKKKLHELPTLEHKYAEGLDLTLADLFIFSTFSFLFISPHVNEFINKNLPLTKKWYHMVKSEKCIESALHLLNFFKIKEFDKPPHTIFFTIPPVLQESIYKGDPARYKSRWRSFTKQKDIDICLKKLQKLKFNEVTVNIKNLKKENVKISEDMAFEELNGENINIMKFKFNNEIIWEKLPNSVNLQDDFPAKRLNRKQQQLENMVCCVLSIAKTGNVIVDFCSGSGHLGILIAYCLPKCKILLVENKEESLRRAFKRVASLGLKNVEFYHCNLDYFNGYFDIGVCLHACGVATDLVLNKCIDRTASFVCCPCCYGGIQSNHILKYPRSQYYPHNFNITSENYYILSHAADQTHGEENSKTVQGKQCMRLVDYDRLAHAKEMGYETTLAMMNPPSCTPKNHILIGLYEKL